MIVPWHKIGFPLILTRHGIARLKRSIIQVSGADATKYLNGLTTNNVIKLAETNDQIGQYTTFLSPQVSRLPLHHLFHY